jgi:hypothetical protein
VATKSRERTFANGIKKLSKPDFEKLLKQKRQFMNDISLKWQRQGLTALISPVFPHSCFLNDQSGIMNQMQEYTQIWDLLGFPCGVLPITRVRNEE